LTPAEISQGSKEATVFVEQLQKRSAAFAVADRRAAVTRILASIRIRSLRKTIESLRMTDRRRRQEIADSAEECRELLGSINQLTLELKHLETPSIP
jgi:hypothetical protein